MWDFHTNFVYVPYNFEFFFYILYGKIPKLEWKSPQQGIENRILLKPPRNQHSYWRTDLLLTILHNGILYCLLFHAHSYHSRVSAIVHCHFYCFICLVHSANLIEKSSSIKNSLKAHVPSIETKITRNGYRRQSIISFWASNTVVFCVFFFVFFSRSKAISTYLLAHVFAFCLTTNSVSISSMVSTSE